MTHTPRYTIRRQVLEVKTAHAQTAPPQLHEQVKALYNQYFLPVIERCCAAVDDPYQHIRLDNIVIDLDAVDLLNPSPKWVEKAIKTLENSLMHAFSSASVAPQPSILDAAQAKNSDANTPIFSGQVLPPQYANTPIAEFLRHFLITGQLPWWADAADRAAIDTAVLESLDANKQQELRAFLPLLKETYYRTRFIRNLQDSTLKRLCEVILQKKWDEQDFMPSLQGKNLAYRLAFWEKIWVLIAHLDNYNFNNIFTETITDPLSKTSQTNDLENKNSVEQQGIDNMGSLIEAAIKNTPPQYVDLKKGSSDTEAHTDPAVNNKPLHLPKPPSAPVSADDRFYSQNAGLVLLSPYLLPLFEHNNWVSDKQFVSNEAANLAVSMLQFLADGQDEAPEFLLTLPKILCGLDPDALHTPERWLTDEEKTDAETFLEAILENVPELGLKTPNALRGSFLLRQGILRPIDNHWTLHVAVETYDLVLHKIPWNFQIIKLPWMKMPIFVDWTLPNY